MTARRLLVLVIALLLVLVVAGIGAAVAVRTSSASATTPAVRYASVTTALEARLRQRYLSYRWVVCVPMAHHTYKGRRLSRCNVDFGEPHIVPYCAVLLDGTLITDHENRALDCGARVRAEEADASVHFR